MLHSEREQINVGHLTWAMDVAGVDTAFFEKAYGASPEFMMLGTGRPAQTLDSFQS